jgi:membrane associated rhomboid family serine protease
MDRYGTTYSDSDDHTPVLWLRGYPVYAAHFIVLVYVVSMLITTTMNLFGVGALLEWLPFMSTQVLQGQVWRVLTYGFVNPPSLDFVFDMLMIAWFGRDVERALGRRSFLWLYAGIYLVTPLLFTAIGVWLPMTRVGETGALALFIAFATIYPDALMMFNLLAKWAALILVGIFTLMALNYHDWRGLISLWATGGVAFAFVRHHQGHFEFPQLNFWRRQPKLRVLPDLPAKPRATAVASQKPSSMAEVDALLDKIAKSGFASLTGAERAKLDSARAELLKKDSGRR